MGGIIPYILQLWYKMDTSDQLYAPFALPMEKDFRYQFHTLPRRWYQKFESRCFLGSESFIRYTEAFQRHCWQLFPHQAYVWKEMYLQNPTR